MELPVRYIGHVGNTGVYRVALADSGLATISAFSILDDGRISRETGTASGLDLDFVRISNVLTDSPATAVSLAPSVPIPLEDGRTPLDGTIVMSFGFLVPWSPSDLPAYNGTKLRGSIDNTSLDERVATLGTRDGSATSGQVSLGEGGAITFYLSLLAGFGSGGAATEGRYLYFGDSGLGQEDPRVLVSQGSAAPSPDGIRLAGTEAADSLYLGIFSNTHVGRGNDTVRGNGGNDTIEAGFGANHVAGNEGSDIVFAYNGFTTAHFQGKRSDYRIEELAPGVRIVTDLVAGRDGSDILYDVEILSFAKPAIFRFYNVETGVHFFTTSAAERDYVKATFPQFQFEGEGMYAVDDPSASNATPVFRFYNVQTKAHFFTASIAERDYVLATFPQFQFEGIAFHQSATEGDDLDAVYRFYNAKTQAHFYTPSAEERDYVIRSLPDWSYERIAYYAPPQSFDPFLIG